MARDIGQEITDEINADRDEVKRLKQSRKQARTGQTTPWRKLPQYSSWVSGGDDEGDSW